MLDTHIWIWWMTGDASLAERELRIITENESNGLGASVVSCWELAQLAGKNRIALTMPILSWVRSALTRPNVVLLPLTPDIAVESTQLPGKFHRDPADRFLVATARAHNCPILTVDDRILRYQEVQKP